MTLPEFLQVLKSAPDNDGWTIIDGKIRHPALAYACPITYVAYIALQEGPWPYTKWAVAGSMLGLSRDTMVRIVQTSDVEMLFMPKNQKLRQRLIQACGLKNEVSAEDMV